MNFVKKLLYSKYFLVLTFFFTVLVFSILLYATIQQDIESGQPSDGYNRANAVVVSNPEGTITINSVEYYMAPIFVDVEISENETLHSVQIIGDPIKESDVPDMKIGTKITVKYPDDNHELIMYTKDPNATHRVHLYILYIFIIILSTAGFILFIRRNRIRDHRLFMEENIRKMHEEKEQSEAGAFNSLDKTISADDIFNPFTDSGIDYNAKYEHDRNMSDATFNENDAFATFGNDPFHSENAPLPEQNNQSVPSYASFGSAVPQTDEPYVGTETQATDNEPVDNDSSYSGYGAPNPSMDAPYDPTAPYTGYGAPNPSMDTPYDPFAPYKGY